MQVRKGCGWQGGDEGTGLTDTLKPYTAQSLPISPRPALHTPPTLSLPGVLGLGTLFLGPISQLVIPSTSSPASKCEARTAQGQAPVSSASPLQAGGSQASVL